MSVSAAAVPSVVSVAVVVSAFVVAVVSTVVAVSAVVSGTAVSVLQAEAKIATTLKAPTKCLLAKNRAPEYRANERLVLAMVVLAMVGSVIYIYVLSIGCLGSYFILVCCELQRYVE